MKNSWWVTAVADQPTTAKGGTWRAVLGVIVAIAAGILVTAGAVAHWASTTIVSTSGFIAAVGPLSDHPQVQTELTATTTARVESALSDAVKSAPFPASLLASLLPQLSAPITTAVDKAVHGPVAASAWTSVLTTIHDDGVSAARGETTSFDLADGTATIDLDTLKTPIIEGLDVPDALKGLLGQVNLGTTTVKTGVPAWVLTAGVRAADAWLGLLVAGIVLCAVAGIIARRTAWGLVASGIAILAASVVGYVVIERGLASNPPPDPLSRSLADAIITAIEGPLGHTMLLAAASGAALVVIGLVVRLMTRRA